MSFIIVPIDTYIDCPNPEFNNLVNSFLGERKTVGAQVNKQMSAFSVTDYFIQILVQRGLTTGEKKTATSQIDEFINEVKNSTSRQLAWQGSYAFGITMRTGQIALI